MTSDSNISSRWATRAAACQDAFVVRMVKVAWKHLQPEKQLNILNPPLVVYKSFFSSSQ